MKNAIGFGLAAGLAAALALAGAAGAQQDTSGGTAGTGSKDNVTGGGGASASSGNTMAGAPSAGQQLDEKLKDQLEKIHAANQGEVQLAQLGATNAQSAEVRQFAEQMQSEHRKMDRQLDQEAQTLGVSLEGKTFQREQQGVSKELQKLQSRTGKDFDKAFMSQMVKAHQSAVKDVGDASKQAQKGKQTELASLLQATETQVQGHLDHAKQVQRSLEKPKQGTGSSGMSQ
jgi:putative membrane protein